MNVGWVDEWMVGWRIYLFFQQRKLMGSSARISSGVCRRGSQEQVPEEGSYAGVGSGGKFRKVPGSSGVKWCWFGSGVQFRKAPEDFGRFRCMLA